MTSLPDNAGTILLPLARLAIAHALGERTEPVAPSPPPWLQVHGASFVTLHRDGTPRGRTGTLKAERPLQDDVAGNAVRAALNDPCFTPLTRPELDAVSIEIAVLSPPELIRATHERDVLAQLRAGVDGVSFRYGHHHGNFLPEMWTQYPEPQEFLAWLKYKSGLPPDFWDEGIELQHYSVSLWSESGSGIVK